MLVERAERNPGGGLVMLQPRNAGRSSDEEIAALVAEQPQKRLVQPRELGALAAFLCHQDALGITMEDIQLNADALW
jgi:NAD(P)-dependent dehydrogenase (short-subunit alcohol dehydrogenase family)